MLRKSSLYVPDGGDCFCAIIEVLFRYYNLKSVNRIYIKCNEIKIKSSISDYMKIPINDLLIWDEIDYKAVLKDAFNITFVEVEKKLNVISKCIDEMKPIILETKSKLCPWRNNNYENGHACLIVECDEMTAICLDPIFSDELVFFPESNFNDSKLIVSYMNTDTIIQLEPPSILESINSFVNNIEKSTYAMDMICDHMKSSNYNACSVDNLDNYFLDSTNSFYINKRYAKIMKFFSYLNEAYNTNKFDNICDLYFDNYSKTSNLYFMIIKYKISGDKRIIERYLNTLFLCNQNERLALQFLKNILNDYK